jgi:DNA primase
MRSVYTKECSNLLDVPEKALISELNKIRTKKHKDTVRKESVTREEHYDEPPPEMFDPGFVAKPKEVESTTYYQEKDILRLMLNYGTTEIDVEAMDEDDNEISVKMKLADFVHEEIHADELSFDNSIFQEIYVLYLNELNTTLDKDPIVTLSSMENAQIREMVVELVTEKYALHAWKKQNIEVHTEEDKIFRAVRDALYAFKARKINIIINDKRNTLKEAQDKGEEIMGLLVELQELGETKRQLLAEQGITIF